jgi:type IV pilus assembly protein PilY1
MLHAFRVGYLKETGLTGTIKGLFHGLFSTSTTPSNTDKLGEEMWAYVPFNAFPYLKYLANNSYCHIYYADLSVRLIEASIGSPGDLLFSPGDDRNTSSWRTIHWRMRFGGASRPDVNPSLRFRAWLFIVFWYRRHECGNHERPRWRAYSVMGIL